MGPTASWAELVFAASHYNALVFLQHKCMTLSQIKHAGAVAFSFFSPVGLAQLEKLWSQQKEDCHRTFCAFFYAALQKQLVS